MSQLLSNREALQDILNTVNNLPEAGSGGDGAGGVELPTLDNPTTESEVFLGKEYIDESGSKKTGTFTIDNELTAQDDLIAQIQSALADKCGGVTLPELSNPGTSDELLDGYELIDKDGNIVVGTHVCSGGGNEDYGYIYLEHNLPEEYGGMMANGVECLCDTSTKVPLDPFGFISFYFMFGGQIVEYVYSEYMAEGDDGVYVETMSCSYSKDIGGTGYICGLCTDALSAFDNHIKIIITFSEEV